MNPEDDEDELVDDDEPAALDPVDPVDDDEAEPVDSPTLPLMARTTPSCGDVSEVAATALVAVSTVACAVVTPAAACAICAGVDELALPFAVSCADDTALRAVVTDAVAVVIAV